MFHEYISMRITYLLIFAFVFAICARSFYFEQAHASALKEINNIDQPVVVELFTSQSCSSCPRADEMLKSLSENKHVIPLAFHVEYWNYLHWTDTLSRPFSEARQRSYALDMSGNRRVYTPQMIMNGADEFVGSREDKVYQALKKAKAIKLLDLSLAQGELTINGLDLFTRDDYHIWLFGTKNYHHQDIKSGENRGRSIGYSHAVLYQRDLGQIKSANLKEDVSDWSEADHFVVLLQKGAYGEIVAAGRI